MSTSEKPQGTDAPAGDAKPHVVVRRNRYIKQWEVWLVRGEQSFRFDYRATKKECLWYRKMLHKALGIEQ